jgi:hypothetical protein
MLKTLHGFLSVDFEKFISVRELMKLASWAMRYSKVCAALKPFVISFYRNIGNRSSTDQVKISNEVKLDIVLWQSFLCITTLRSNSFARSIDSFRPSAVSLTIEFDASLDGFGFIVGRLVGRNEFWGGVVIDPLYTSA